MITIVTNISGFQVGSFSGSKVSDLLLCLAEKCHLHSHLLLHLQVFAHRDDDDEYLAENDDDEFDNDRDNDFFLSALSSPSHCGAL